MISAYVLYRSTVILLEMSDRTDETITFSLVVQVFGRLLVNFLIIHFPQVAFFEIVLTSKHNIIISYITGLHRKEYVVIQHNVPMGNTGLVA